VNQLIKEDESTPRERLEIKCDRMRRNDGGHHVSGPLANHTIED